MKRRIVILILVLTALFCGNNFSQQKKGVRIALIYPELTKKILYKYDNTFNPTESWELYFMSNNFDYEMMNEDELENIDSDIKVVIIPSLEVVDEDIIENIKELLKDGKGILFTGNFAEYDDNGNRVNKDYQNNILGFRISRLGDEKTLTLNHTLNSNTPLSIGLNPGQKILLRRRPSLYYATDLSSTCGYVGNYIQDAGELSGMIINKSSEKRILWYGFDSDQLIGNHREQLLDNSIRWLSSAPEIFMNYWPSDYSSAVIIYKNINKPTDFAGNELPGIKSVKVNYFVTPEILESSDYYLEELKNSGNINILWDDFFFSGMYKVEKTGWLKRTVPLIRKYIDQRYFGISSYGDFYDSTSYDLLSREGYEFIFSAGYSNSFSYSYDSKKSIYLFNRTTSPGDGYISRIKFILNQGGIGYVNEDSLSGDNTDFLKNTDCWITTFSELLEWIQNRRHLGLSIDPENENQYKIEIKNNGSSIIRDAGIWISVPGSEGNLILQYYPESGEMTYNYENKMYYLKIKSISGYQTISYRIFARM